MPPPSAHAKKKHGSLAPGSSSRPAQLISEILFSNNGSAHSLVSQVLITGYFPFGCTQDALTSPRVSQGFLSYRVRTDQELVERLYYAGMIRSLKLWWDVKCLPMGQPWCAGFANGLRASTLFVPVLSVPALAALSTMTANSPVDNVLLEQRLALERRRRPTVAAPKGRPATLKPMS